MVVAAARRDTGTEEEEEEEDDALISACKASAMPRLAMVYNSTVWR